jgi:integrase/recombinase XerD
MTVTVAMAKHYDTPVVAIYFAFDPQLNNAVRKIPFVRYSKTFGCWYVPFKTDGLKHITDAFKDIAVVHAEGLKTPKEPAEGMQRNLQDYKGLLVRRRYSTTTQVNYCGQFQKFLMYFNRDADTITEKDIVDYMHYLIGDKKVSASTQNIVINALKFYYEHVRGGERKMYSLQRPFMEENFRRFLASRRFD